MFAKFAKYKEYIKDYFSFTHDSLYHTDNNYHPQSRIHLKNEYIIVIPAI